MTITPLRISGNRGEAIVAQYLIRKGCTILAQNFSWRGGEIDIIVKKGDIIAFIEVKARHSEPSFYLSTVVTPAKQHKIIRTAQRFMLIHHLTDLSIRFDIALVLLDTDAIRYIPNAFTAPDTTCT